MKVCLSRSGDAGKTFARFPHGRLPRVIQSVQPRMVKPRMSDIAIAEGSQSPRDLEGTSFGIVVVSAANRTPRSGPVRIHLREPDTTEIRFPSEQE
ncbi:hypothetical protein FHX81_0375 [Saccharothrix saharensis]|uniref:Uncharacterized protein n=1 Tax=Saccharothrix saharensis TaxID=571190 RepID=A0A543J5M1_9PSEU|nr:hypothetical protein [Saccharothrix saharensis]TQM78126.1 hypothetical protein FHX81_0375 [Saccharothrix saharensis]